ncbi:type 2 lanthipeptide synthetase LanM [Priestia filamentosa]|uniref:type 2 lanthipeptide synthetase LanM n=1 Tax=Priestia filamentosa TaxID=1402861 RepID=UPI001C1E04ED|nr:type 2 lanthipeptide synthetase LanM [Priestia filamentosa]
MNTQEFMTSIFPELKGNITEVEKIINAVSGKKLSDFESNEHSFSVKIEMKDMNFYSKQTGIKLDDDLPFAQFYSYMIGEHLDGFYQLIEQYAFIKSPDLFCECVGGQLIDKLWNLSYKSLIHLMKLSNLEGETEEERFKYFNNTLLGDPAFMNEVMRNHRPLIDTLQKEIKRTLSYIKEIIDHCQENLSLLKIRFNAPSLSLREISIGKGDTHQNGKTVSILDFEELRLVYKPRNLNIDENFQQFLQYLNKELNLDLKTVHILSLEEYGFMEFVSHLPIENEEDIACFYKKIGFYVAIFYILNGNDMHFENVIAHKNDPIFIDLESLFAPQLYHKYMHLDKSLQKLYTELETSVSGMSLLSTEIGRQHLMDIGGIASNKGQRASYRSAQIENIYSDKMTYKLIYPLVEEKQNNPLLDGQTVDSSIYEEIIIESFTFLYRYFMNHKDRIGSIICELFSNKKVRYIHRSTMFYSKLINMHAYPLFMRNAQFKELLFHRIGMNHVEQDLPFLKSEYYDLKNLDVPYFQSNTSLPHVFDSRGKEIRGVLSVSPLEFSLDKVIKLCEEDLAEQKRLMAISFMNKRESERDRTNITFKAIDNMEPFEKGNYVKTAVEIGDYLVEKMISIDEHGYWLGPTINLKRKEDTWITGLVEPDVYNGSGGISIFLSYLYAVTKDEKYKKTVQKSLTSITEYLDKFKDLAYKESGIGGFVGLSSYIYTLFKCAKYMQDEKLMNQCLNHISLIRQQVQSKNIRDTDYIYGLTGAIHILSNITDNIKGEMKFSLIETLDILGKQLSKNKLNDIKLSGFAHGLSSIMSSYALLYKQTKSARYRDLTYESMRVLDSFYSESNNSWYNSKEQKDISYGFCHGSPGILMGYLLCHKSGIEIPVEKLRGVVMEMKKNCFGKSITYCHGDIGNLDIMDKFAQEMGDDLLLAEVESTTIQLYKAHLEFITKSNLSHAHVLGAMLGISGVGLFLLNHASHKEEQTHLLSFQ